MKYKIFKYLTVFCSLSVVLTSCVTDEDLVQVDPNVETTGSFWKTDEDALLGINAAYGSLLPDGAYMRSTPLLLDLKGDDCVSFSPWGSMYNVGRFNSNPSDNAIYGWAFETYYQGIFRSNQVLDNVPGIAMKDTALKSRILGQAYFMRGLFFFHAVNMFKKVPLPLESKEIYRQQKNPRRGMGSSNCRFQSGCRFITYFL